MMNVPRCWEKGKSSKIGKLSKKQTQTESASLKVSLNCFVNIQICSHSDNVQLIHNQPFSHAIKLHFSLIHVTVDGVITSNYVPGFHEILTTTCELIRPLEPF